MTVMFRVVVLAVLVVGCAHGSLGPLLPGRGPFGGSGGGIHVAEVFERVGLVNECRRGVADGLLQELKQLGPGSHGGAVNNERKVLYNRVALELTNCHLRHHGRQNREGGYATSLQMSEPHFAIFTQFALAVERICSELDMDRSQRAVEAMLEALFAQGVATNEDVAHVRGQLQQAAMDMAVMLRAQRKARLEVARGHRKHRDAMALMANQTEQAFEGQSERLGHVVDTMLRAELSAVEALRNMEMQEDVLQGLVAESLNVKSHLAENSRLLLDAKHEAASVMEAWAPMLETVYVATTYRSSLAVALTYVVWLGLLRWTQSPRAAMLLFISCATLEHVVVIPGDAVAVERMRTFAMVATLVIGLLAFARDVSLHFGVQFYKNRSTLRDHDENGDDDFFFSEADPMTAALVDYIVQLRCADPLGTLDNVHLSPHLEKLLSRPPAGYECRHLDRDDEEDVDNEEDDLEVLVAT